MKILVPTDFSRQNMYLVFLLIVIWRMRPIY